MLTISGNIALILFCIAASCAFFTILNSLWSPARRRVHNDVIGWQISVIGTIYAVIIGFMLYAVWGNFQAADANADSEANAAVDLFRISKGLPTAQRDLIQSLSQNYVNAIITEDWPAMRKGREGKTSNDIIEQLWSVTTNTETKNDAQQTDLNHAISILTELTEHRRLRRLQSHSSLPGLLWAVLICGGIITIVSCCLIGSENSALHLVLIIGLTLLVSLILAAIAEIDGPFRGSVRISPYAFVQAQQSMNYMKKR